MLACAEVHDLILRELETSAAKYGWSVGRYVVMPEQLHFFCAATSEVESKPIETFIGKFKEWSARMIHREFNLLPPIWQAEFFDHILRSNESHAEKWLYVRDNPVRAGLVTKSEEWPYAGEIEEL